MEPQIREVVVSDLDALYEVCLRTGDSGSDASALYKDPRLLGEVYVGPYVMLDGAIGLTAVDSVGPGGYALAAIDTRGFERCANPSGGRRCVSAIPTPAPTLRTSTRKSPP